MSCKTPQRVRFNYDRRARECSTSLHWLLAPDFSPEKGMRRRHTFFVVVPGWKLICLYASLFLCLDVEVNFPQIKCFREAPRNLLIKCGLEFSRICQIVKMVNCISETLLLTNGSW